MVIVPKLLEERQQRDIHNGRQAPDSVAAACSIRGEGEDIAHNRFTWWWFSLLDTMTLS